MRFITDFADQAVLLPLLALGAAFLAAQRQWRVLAAWIAALCGVSGIVLVLKITFYACGWMWPALDPDGADFRSPSGHVAASSVLYGSLVVLVLAGTRRNALLAAAAGSVCIAGLIGVTRVGLGAHSLAEVLVGAGVGIAGAMVFAHLAGGHIAGRSGRPILLAALLLAAAMHGYHLPAETAIQGRGVTLLRMAITACDPHGAAAALNRPASGLDIVPRASVTVAGPF